MADRLAKQPLSINKNNIDEICQKLIPIINERGKYYIAVREGIDLFNECRKKWISKYGKQYRFAIKDNPSFTIFLTTFMYGGNIDKLKVEANEPTYTGDVISVKQDRKGKYFGFIKAKPENVFFHQENNKHINFADIQGKTVTYHLMQNQVNGKIKAKDVMIVE